MIVMHSDVAVQILQGTKMGKAARSIMLRGESAVAPPCFCEEVAEAAALYRRQGVYNDEQSKSLISVSLRMVTVVPLNTEWVQDAYDIQVETGLSATEASYCLLARKLDAALFSFSPAIQEACCKLGISCIQEVDL